MNGQNIFRIAMGIAENSSCVARKVGAVLVIDDSVAATGYNRTIGGEIGCGAAFADVDLSDHAAKAEHKRWSSVYEVHAEVDCLCAAMRAGVRTDGSMMFVTYAPCLQCAQTIAAAGVDTVYCVPETDPAKSYKNAGIGLLIRCDVDLHLLNASGEKIDMVESRAVWRGIDEYFRTIGRA